MTQPFRSGSGGRVDRGKPLSFTFNGRRYSGFQGDTLASALLANGVHLVARSFKYHRPRGFVAAGAEEPNGIVQLGRGARTEPNVRATQIELFDGLEAASVNAWPSVDFDIGAVNGLLSKIFVAGFYYKTFKGPKGFWKHVYEPMIRKAAGWGKAPAEPDPDRYDRMNIHCDVLVVGGGPAGLSAALAAGRSGARVVLVDEQAELGGSLLAEDRRIDGKPATAWVETARAQLAEMPEVTVLTRTTAFGYYDQNYVCLVERRTDHLGTLPPAHLSRQRIWHVRARQVVLATGAHERPLVFADNDRPGIMLAGAVRTYIQRYGVLPGRRAVLFTNNDSAYETALALSRAGVDVAAVVDSRRRSDGELVDAVRKARIEILNGSVITGTRGRGRVVAVEVSRLSEDGTGTSGVPKTIACDLVAVSGGWSPVVHLFCHSQGKLDYDEGKACFVPGRSVQAQQTAGALNGTFGLAGCLAEGVRAGQVAADATGFEAASIAVPDVEEPAPGGIEPLWVVPSRQPLGHGKAKHFVDLQNDSTAADILLATREGFESVEHVKRYTLTGFGTDQGKTANINALAILSDLLRKPIPDTGTTTFRPPYTPVPFGALAGRDVGILSDPVRVTPMHDWHREHGAIFEDVGQWKRPWYYPKQGESMRDAVNRECLAVRNGVGVLDASTLGKIDIVGPDAAEFLNRIYTNAWSKLGVGRTRYGLMCHEDGMVFDDGTTTRLAEDHFLMTTTTGNAAAVLDWLENWLQTEWPDLKVYCTSVTEQWAVVSIAGPKSRAVLEKLVPETDLSPEAFPFMSMREAIVAGIPARVFRVSFTGELSYEINVPWYHGRALWEAVMRAGAESGITPYGTEAMHVLRAEKGFIIVGQETDGTVTPVDLGMDWAVSKTKDFLGKRSLSRSDTARSDRKQLVGLLTEDDRKTVLPEGAQLVSERNAQGRPPIPMIGHVTSSYYSAALERSIALALVKGGRERMGEVIAAPLADRVVRLRIVDPVFYDKEGRRRDGNGQ